MRKGISFYYDKNENIKDENRDLTIIEQVYAKEKRYKIKCNKCGFDSGEYYRKGIKYEEYTVSEYNLKDGQGCPCCCKFPQIVVCNINSIYTKEPWLITQFGMSEEFAKSHTPQSNEMVDVKCFNCGKKHTKKCSDLFKNRNMQCVCGDGYSKGHKFVYNLLTQLKVSFKDNYTPKWSCYFHKYKNKETHGEYDFIIEEMKLIIEFDGEFHREDNHMNGKSAEISKYEDNQKDFMAISNGYEIIRIDNVGSIRRNCENKLNNVFNLTDIDWNECERFSISSKVAEACNIWSENNGNITTVKIGEIIGADKGTVRRYLETGNDINLCNPPYNPKNEMKKCLNMGIEATKKAIEVYNENDEFMGVYESASYIDKNSLFLFGIHFDFRGISSVCNGKTKTHKGFKFKFA